MSPTPDQSARRASLGFLEFLLLMAAMMATQAVAVDGILPALPTIATALQLSDANLGQLIVTSYVLGIGIGQLPWGVLSDRYGRRPVLLTGLFLYVLAALLCALSRSFVALLLWRVLHGIASASLVVTRATIRDRYSGSQMARVMSLTFIVFLMVPMLAPSIGQLILWLAPWRYIFGFFAGFSALVLVWVWLRLPETLHPEYRLMLDWRHILRATRIVVGTRQSLCYTLAATLMLGSVFAYVGMMPQIFAEVFHLPRLMPAIFALCAGGMAVAAYLNSRNVEHIGMRAISHSTLLAFILIAAGHATVAAASGENLATFIVFQALTMACFSPTVANFGALAMEPLGAIAGLGAALQGLMTTCGGALLGALVGRFFNRTTLPLSLGALLCGVLALCCVLLAEKGRLFESYRDPRLAQPQP
ncbi:MAG TPA: multidrug effflux MFS transporter [Steroidobacteraceae bacterium]|nr:multidrug effflux MFS transporter [Steroidobacteraceae bacterium]